MSDAPNVYTAANGARYSYASSDGRTWHIVKYSHGRASFAGTARTEALADLSAAALAGTIQPDTEGVRKP
jgi:hypothetical protein